MNIREFHQSLIQKQIPIIVDSLEVNLYLTEQGYKTKLFDLYNFESQEAAFLIFSDYRYYYKLKELWQTSKSRIVHLPAVKFDGRLETIDYSFKQIIAADIEQCLTIRSNLYEKIAEADSDLSLSDWRGSKLNCHLGERIEIANNDEELDPGWFYSIAEFLESSIVNTKGDKASFSVDGTFFFDGILYQTTTEDTKEENIKPLKYLAERVASSQEKYLQIEDNIIKHLILDGQDVTSVLLDMSYHLERNLSLTEIAFGCNKGILETINWEINSVLNEGVYGTHVGIGMAQKAPHIDFISQTLKLD
ncbi:hypothetical protein [Limnofasciculus baicalensis]|uniref:Crocagin biosynthetic protein CgnE/B domain-containing protein n=1 Tax=Limnofasciculus baicalensis BBK-W-15 TaxID=2699891 RepID=A0AAE3GV61_9CYAN|nr:hypothetical protein [Limnofasciculus baicalensis]MCP2731261.1 hypothetical protein [Limnofasciculus baicalensis BBK-W-15]